MAKYKELIESIKDNNLQKAKNIINQESNIQEYALGLAAVFGNLNIVKYLVDQGVNIHANDDYALEWATTNNHQEVVDYLKNYEKPKEINLKELNTDGRIVCAKCGRRLNIPVGLGNKYNYCPVCEG